MNAILDTISDAGYALDTPGALLRGLLSGRPGERASGEDLLGAYGMPGGALGGMAAEMVLDPMALGGLAAGAYKGIRGLTSAGNALAHADDANPLLRGIGSLIGDEEGALRPFMEIGRRSDPDYVNAATWFHGNRTPGLTPERIDPRQTNPFSLYGPGFYETQSPTMGNGYTRPRGRSLYGPPKGTPTVYAVRNEFGKILDMDLPPPEDVRALLFKHVDSADRDFDLGGDFRREYSRKIPVLREPTAGEMYEQYQGQLLDTMEEHGLPTRGEAGDSMFDLAMDLRQGGYDALTHTGGLRTRAGLAHGPHQVLIGLDPNDMYFTPPTGRDNQIRSLKAIHPDALAELLNWDRGATP